MPEMNPYKSWGCSLCGAQAPKKLRGHGMFKKRMSWLRNHRQKKHPEAFEKSIKKGVKTRMSKRNPKRSRKMTRKQKILGLSTTTLALLAAGGFAVWYFVFRDKGTTT